MRHKLLTDIFLFLIFVLVLQPPLAIAAIIYVDANSTGIDGPVVTLAGRQTIIKEGIFGFKYFPDGAISVLRGTPSYPFRIIFPVCDYTCLVEGTSLDNLTRSTKVLEHGKPGAFDNGYAGINGVYYHSNGKLYGYYHTEDHENMPEVPGTGGVPGFYASIGAAESSDNGYTWQKLGPALKGALPKDHNNGQPCQGIGEVSIVIEKSRRYLYAYYTDWSRIHGRPVTICMARADVSEYANPPTPGSWKKYCARSFTEDGLGGMDTPVVSFQHLNADAAHPHVYYSDYLGKYIMVFCVYAHWEYLAGAHPEISGIYVAYSKDGIHWSEPMQLVKVWCNILLNKEIGAYPSIIWKDSIGKEGRLVYGYSKSFGHSPPKTGHYMVGHNISFRIGEKNGSSWSDAYRSIRYAISTAMPGDDIWVAKGTYKPNQGLQDPNGSGNRHYAFELKNGVSIYGGFPPGGGTWAERNPSLYETILSGDLKGNDLDVSSPNDLLNESSRIENSFHVIVSNGNDFTATLNGFTITGGNANSDYPANQGGGMLVVNGSPTVVSCVFKNNSAKWAGGGMANEGGSANLNSCMFTGNSAATGGGGMINWKNAEPNLTNCTFNNNSSSDGGGVNNYQGSPTMNDCTFSGNLATVAGGVKNYSNKSKLTGCLFTRNIATNDGGGMVNSESNSVLYNCKFIENSAGNNGGGIYNYKSNGKLMGSSFIGNSAVGHGGGLVDFQSNPSLIKCTFVSNSAKLTGGGIHNNNSNTILNNCLLEENFSHANGAGIFCCCDSYTELINCTIIGNISKSVGGSYYSVDSKLVLTNCVFRKNSDINGVSELESDSYR